MKLLMKKGASPFNQPLKPRSELQKERERFAALLLLLGLSQLAFAQDIGSDGIDWFLEQMRNWSAGIGTGAIVYTGWRVWLSRNLEAEWFYRTIGGTALATGASQIFIAIKDNFF